MTTLTGAGISKLLRVLRKIVLRNHLDEAAANAQGGPLFRSNEASARSNLINRVASPIDTHTPTRPSFDPRQGVLRSVYRL